MMRTAIRLLLSASACLALSGCCCTAPGGPYTGPGFAGPGHGCDPCGYGRGGITDVLFPLLSPRIACGSGCGILYWNEWLNDPPECTDPCDADGQWTGYAAGCAAPTCGHLICNLRPLGGCQFQSLAQLFAAPWQGSCSACASPSAAVGEPLCTACLAARGAPTVGAPLAARRAAAPALAPPAVRTGQQQKDYRLSHLVQQLAGATSTPVLRNPVVPASAQRPAQPLWQR